MSEILGRSRSLCPVCLAALPADIVRRGRDVLLLRRCPEHGEFAGLVWRGEPDFTAWKRPKTAAAQPLAETRSIKGCPHDCGRCPDHGQRACTVLFEITRRCNLRCPVCFADAGNTDQAFAPLEDLLGQLRWIKEHAGAVVLQISGGEPSLYPQLPELVRAGKDLFPAVQLNSNGLLLAQKPELARQLATAGLSWVFLQFDGTNDDIYRALRGRPLLEQKLEAIANCRAAGLSVVLVPTLARGVNDQDLGNLLDLALSLAPTVRGLHLQPMTASGRNSLAKSGEALTLPETLQALCAQSKERIRPEHATPPGCEHERCSFHCRYRLSPSGRMIPLREDAPCCPAPADASGGAPVGKASGGREDAPCCPDKAAGKAPPAARGASGKAPPAARGAAPGPRQGHDAPAPPLWAQNFNRQPAKNGCLENGSTSPLVPLAPPSAGELPGDKTPPTATDGAGRAIEVILRAWQGPDQQHPAPQAADAFEAFIAESRARSFSVTCMAFQDVMNADLERLKGCCVHVFVPPQRLIPFCARNMTSLSGAALHPR